MLLGGTGDELLRQVFLAEIVNRASGGAVIAPWEVHLVPDDWLEAAQAATNGMSKWRQLLKDGGING